MKISNRDLHDAVSPKQNLHTWRTATSGRPHLGLPPNQLNHYISIAPCGLFKYARVLRLDSKKPETQLARGTSSQVRRAGRAPAVQTWSRQQGEIPTDRPTRSSFLVAAPLPSHSEPETDLLVSFSSESLLFSARLVLGLGRGWWWAEGSTCSPLKSLQEQSFILGHHSPRLWLCLHTGTTAARLQVSQHPSPNSIVQNKHESTATKIIAQVSFPSM